ncbi:hypothetical protein EI94DRAFT_1725132 [Lactarius quietus]|nr:hypothetical protein EI94DRAFT_1725132 [Lactarius quietus]
MPENAEHIADPEHGFGISESIPIADFGVDARRSQTFEGTPYRRTQKKRYDFDDGANALWSLHGNMAETHDKARFSRLSDEMDQSVSLYVYDRALFSAVVASFLVQISEFAKNPGSIRFHPIHVPINSTPPTHRPPSYRPLLSKFSPAIQPFSIPPPSPYPTFEPSFLDMRVNAWWLVSLACILSAALLVFLTKYWIRSYNLLVQRFDHPLKRARSRQFLLERSNQIQKVAQAIPGLVIASLFLFFWGLGDSMLNINTIVGVITIVPCCLCGTFYLYFLMQYLRGIQWLFKKYLISRPIFFLIQKLMNPLAFFAIGACPRPLKHTKRAEGDVLAIQWLIEKAAASADMEPLVLAIPGTFNTKWGREVWMNVSNERWSDPDTLEPQTDSPLLNHSYFDNEQARHRRMRACVEATASLVCCVDFNLEWFGEVGKLVSEIGLINKINQSPTTSSDPLFIIRWTCLSIVVVRQELSSNRLHVLAGYAVTGLARFQSGNGQTDEVELQSAQRIEECLKTAWKLAEELRQAFGPWTQKKTKEKISELERIEVEADGMEDVDWRISLCQDAMDEDTYGLARQLPGVSFDERRRIESFLISDTFNTSATGTAPVTPQLIFPGQQAQALARLGSKLREVLDGHVAEGYEEALESLKSVVQVPLSLRRPNGLMKRQLWRLEDLRDGGGLGFTVELFFLSLRRLLSIPSLHESNIVRHNDASKIITSRWKEGSIYYIGAFKIITSHLEKSKDSLGTQRILLNIICDLIIRSRGVFSSDFSYPKPITTMLVDTVARCFRV